MRVFILLVTSCQCCDTNAIQVFDHRPTEDEINKLKSDCGEMYCLRETVSELELNAAPKLFSFDRDY
jgi:hypothetical protein